MNFSQGKTRQGKARHLFRTHTALGFENFSMFHLKQKLQLSTKKG